MTLTIEDIKQDVYDLRSHKAHETLSYSLIALEGEVGEVCNRFKKELRKFGSEGMEEIAKEIPDILFYLVQFATDAGIDIEKEWNLKMLHNSLKYGKQLSRVREL